MQIEKKRMDKCMMMRQPRRRDCSKYKVEGPSGKKNTGKGCDMVVPTAGNRGAIVVCCLVLFTLTVDNE